MNKTKKLVYIFFHKIVAFKHLVRITYIYMCVGEHGLHADVLNFFAFIYSAQQPRRDRVRESAEAGRRRDRRCNYERRSFQFGPRLRAKSFPLFFSPFLAPLSLSLSPSIFRTSPKQSNVKTENRKNFFDTICARPSSPPPITGQLLARNGACPLVW